MALLFSYEPTPLGSLVNSSFFRMPQDDLRALLLDSEDDFVRELADITPTVPDGQQHHTPQISPARAGVAFRGADSPPSPPPRGGVGGRYESEGQGGRSPVSDRRQSRRESERWGGLANATTVSSVFRRCASYACLPNSFILVIPCTSFVHEVPYAHSVRRTVRHMFALFVISCV